MLALYQPHNVLWFMPITLLGMAVFMVSCVRRKSRGGATPIQIASWCLGAGGIVGMIVVSSWDKAQLRGELRDVVPAEAAHVILAKGATTRPITDAAAAARILTLLTGAKGIAAHHSHPVEPVTVSFEFRGNAYRYRVGRDSAVPNEFWVICLNPGCSRFGEMELGRLQTSEWAPLIEDLLKETK